MKTMIKVVFTAKRKVYASCKPAEYFVADENYTEAIKKATDVFKKENKNYKYYSDAIATNVRVI